MKNNQKTTTESQPAKSTVNSLDRRQLLKQLIAAPPFISLVGGLRAEAKAKGILPDDLKITDEGILQGPVVVGDSSISQYSDVYFDKKPLKGADDGPYFYTLSSTRSLTIPATILADNTLPRALDIAFKLMPVSTFNPPNLSSIEFSYLTPYNLPGTPIVSYSSYTKKGDEVIEIAISNVEVLVALKSGASGKKPKKGNLTLTQVKNAAGTTLTLSFKHLASVDIDFDFSFTFTLLSLVGGASSSRPQSANKN
ncbi:MAG TPA: hypothetical protein VJ302_31630 [Blastocatellia bacterium]|nr:hypothetical protein [Blastocatellia bacterium]